jgi:hypothetical protein
MRRNSHQQFSEEARIDETIPSHEQQIAWHRQTFAQLVRQSVWAMGHYMQDDIVRQTSVPEHRGYGAHPAEVELADTVLVEFFYMSNC